jgi:hypothetical protein
MIRQNLILQIAFVISFLLTYWQYLRMMSSGVSICRNCGQSAFSKKLDVCTQCQCKQSGIPVNDEEFKGLLQTRDKLKQRRKIILRFLFLLTLFLCFAAFSFVFFNF